MVNLTRIYTKTGDDGTTSLGDMSRTSKNDPRLEAYATVDEANSYIGVVLALPQLDEGIRKLLVRVQNDLFDVGADLCTPVVDAPAHEPLRVLESQISYLEEQIDHYNSNLEALRSFVLPSVLHRLPIFMLRALSFVAQNAAHGKQSMLSEKALIS